MQIIRHKTVKTAVGFALSAGLGLTALTADLALTPHTASAAIWSPAKSGPTSAWNPANNSALAQLMSDAAAPSLTIGSALPASLAGSALLTGSSSLMAAAVAADKPDPARLKAALLTPAELPTGYAPMPDALKAFTDAGSRVGACDTTPAPADQPVVPDRPVAPGAPAGPGVPVPPGPRSAAADGKPGDDRKPGDGIVRAAFMKGPTGPVLIEAINPSGHQAARDIVAQVAGAPKRCPSYDEGKPGEPDALHMATFPLEVPRLGNRSAGVRFEVDMTSPRVTVHGKMAAVSVRGMALTVLLVNLEVPGQHELEAITRTAVRKIQQQK